MYLTFRWRGELWKKASLYSRIEVTFSGIGYSRQSVRAQWHELWSVCILVEVSMHLLLFPALCGSDVHSVVTERAIQALLFQEAPAEKGLSLRLVCVLKKASFGDII